MIAKLKQIPPTGWIALTALAGVVFLAWHKYSQDDIDTDWTSPKELQAPMVAAFQPVPGMHGEGRQMGCSSGFRSRGYPGTLVDANFSIIGEI